MKKTKQYQVQQLRNLSFLAFQLYYFDPTKPSYPLMFVCIKTLSLLEQKHEFVITHLALNTEFLGYSLYQLTLFINYFLPNGFLEPKLG